MKFFESIFVQDVRIILFVVKKSFNQTRRRNFSTSCLTENWSVFSGMGTKFKPLLRTNFSDSESGKLSGVVITVLRLSGDETLVNGGQISWSSFWALIWYKWLKSLQFCVLHCYD